MSRAIRRHHERRLKARRKRQWSDKGTLTPRRIGMLYQTPHPCSCLGCGNARHYHGKTRQEIRAEIEQQEPLDLDWGEEDDFSRYLAEMGYGSLGEAMEAFL